jgi:phosphomethylpyrimidine synthase
MKSSAEVREFARLQDAGLLNSTPLAEPGAAGRGPAMHAGEAEAGMSEMSEKYRDGGDLYVPAK